ncbi:MAG: rhomboid family intramembrane serine protease [Rhodoglobus sp.]
MSEHTEEEQAPVCYRHPKRETWVRCQRCDRPICPECQTPAAVGVQCPECIKEGSAGMQRRSPGWVRAFAPGRGTVVTYVLIALNVVIYILQFVTAQELTDAWYLLPYSIGSEPWRLITSAFLHSPGVIFHILFNMYALFIFGPVLEAFLGRTRFLALYLIGALGGSLGVLTSVEVWVLTDGVRNAPAGALGASGAVFALMGAVFAMRKAMGVDVRQLLIVLVINLAVPFFVPGIAWEGHVGGLVIGFLVGLILVRTRRPDQRRAQILGIAGIAVGLLVLFGIYLVSAPQVYF